MLNILKCCCAKTVHISAIRAGRDYAITSEEIVLGDVLRVRPGDQIVVDGEYHGHTTLEVDESALTGESDLVTKRDGDLLSSGSFCMSGSGLYVVQKVGADSSIDQVISAARTYRRRYTPLQREIDVIVRVLVVVTAYIAVLLGLAAVLNDIPLIVGVEMVTVITKLIPNGLFMTVTLAYAVGAVRIARKGALVQYMNAVEALSNVTVLCLDKTGTLTTNRIVLDSVVGQDGADVQLRQNLGDYCHSVSAPNPTSAAIALGCGGQKRPVSDEVSFSSERKWSALRFDDAVYVLGAAEILAPHITADPTLNARITDLAGRGLRVLLFASAAHTTALHDAHGHDQLPRQLTFLGLVSLSDELRPHVRQTLTAFADAGVALKIISGDNPTTVAALARLAGVAVGTAVLSGADIEGLSDAALDDQIEAITVFGRVAPPQKARLVQALQRRKQYVAMIGDGVNDVLALKQANLGIAPQSGTQAARGVAGLILLNDSFAALPLAFIEGQRIRSGMQTVIKLFMARILSEALLIVSLLVINIGFPYTPKQSAIVVLFTVGIPVVGLTLWAKPVGNTQGRLIPSLPHFVLPAAFTLTLSAIGIYVGYALTSAMSLKTGNPALSEAERLALSVPVAQTALVTFMILCGLVLVVFVVPPSPFWVGAEPMSGDWRPTLLAFGVLLSYATLLCVPPLRQFFELTLLQPTDYLMIGLVAALWAMLVRAVWRGNYADRFFRADTE